MNNKPSYSEYFTQASADGFYDWASLLTEDLGWIDQLSVAEGEVYSKDFGSDEFPLFCDFPESFAAKYRSVVKVGQNEIDRVAQTAEEVVEIDESRIYLDCEDGNHYFSTQYYANGQISQIENNGEFDSTDTAVYAFTNDFKDWKAAHGKAYAKLQNHLELEALREPIFMPEFDEKTGCQHDDLGSRGYKHGSIVKCPHCGSQAEVW